jgi:hypothetical protein
MSSTRSTKRKRAAIGALILISLFAIVTIIAGMFMKEDSVTRRDYDQIRSGMTLSEVEAILRSPGIRIQQEVKRAAPDRNTAEWAEEGPFDNRPDDNEPGRRLVWIGRDSSVMVRLDRQNRVTDKLFHRFAPMTFSQWMRYLFKI